MKRFFVFTPFLIWSITIIVLCILPGSTFKSVKTFEHTDKVVHAFLYFFHVLFLYIPLRLLNNKLTFKHYLIIFTIPILLGLILEYIQHNYIPNRVYDIGDVLANIFGLLCFIFSPEKMKLYVLKRFQLFYFSKQ